MTANFDFSFLDTNAAPVIRAIAAMSWFAAPKEGHTMVNCLLQAR